MIEPMFIEPEFDKSHKERVIHSIIEQQIESIKKTTSYVKHYEYEEYPGATGFGINVDLTLYVNENEYLISRIVGGDKIEQVYSHLGFGINVNTTVIFVKDRIINKKGEVIWTL